MAKKNEEKKTEDSKPETHILLEDCIVSDMGGMQRAGSEISEKDVTPSTWKWLKDRQLLKSMSEIESEADADAPDNESANVPDKEPAAPKE